MEEKFVKEHNDEVVEHRASSGAFYSRGVCAKPSLEVFEELRRLLPLLSSPAGRNGVAHKNMRVTNACTTMLTHHEQHTYPGCIPSSSR